MTSPTQRRHDELVALLTEIRERLPEPEGVKEEPAPAFYDPDLVARNFEAFKHELETPMREHGECCDPGEVTEDQPIVTRIVDRDGDVWERREEGWSLWHSSEWGPWRGHGRWPQPPGNGILRPATPADLARVGIEDEPAPADDLPDEPVEPGDLRAGDRVAFTWVGERIICTLVSHRDGEVLRSDAPDTEGYCPGIVARSSEWCRGISDVRLIERGPREDDLDEAVWHQQFEKEKARAEKAESERDDAQKELRMRELHHFEEEQKAAGWQAKHAALREDVDTERGRWTADGHVYGLISGLLNRDDARDPHPSHEPDATDARYEREDAEARQDDPDTVTLRRDDAAQLLRFWEGDRTSNAPNTMASRVRAALGWGDEA